MKRWWLELLDYARPHRGGLALLLLLIVLGVAVSALTPWPLKLLVDYVLPGRPLPEAVETVLPVSAAPATLLVWLVAATVLLFLAQRLIDGLRAYIQSGVGHRMSFALGAKLFDHLQSLALRYHGAAKKGDLVRRVVTDSSCVRELILGVLLPLTSSVATMVVLFAIMWQLDASLSLLAAATAVPMLGLIRAAAPRLTERGYEQQEVEGQVMTLIEQTLTAMPAVQAFGRESYAESRFREFSGQSLGAYMRSLTAQIQFKLGVGGILAMGTATLMAFGGARVLEGRLSVGTLLVFLAYLAALYAPLETLAYLSSGFAAAAGRARRALEVLHADDRVVETAEPQPVPDLPPLGAEHIRFENVTFGYQPGRPVLKNASLVAARGEIIALVGRTGAGKTTLVSLLPRLIDVWHGRITFAGIDVRDLRVAELRNEFSLVLQQSYVLPGTIADNIAYGRPSAQREEIVVAAQAANADEFIRRLPQGYDTVLGERGLQLSEGQKQRLAIARALLKKASVLILDEPSAALDAESESLLVDALERVKESRTTFVIAHRLSTIRNADRILVLDDGAIAETGRYEQLRARGGLFDQLARALERGPSGANSGLEG